MSLSLALLLFVGFLAAGPAGDQPGNQAGNQAGKPTRWESSAAPREADDEGAGACADSATDDPALDDTLKAMALKAGGADAPLAIVKLTGLRTLKEEAVWDAVGGKPERWDMERAASLVRRLVGLGVFARVTPTLDVRAAGGATLDIALEEHETVRRVVIEGLGELHPRQLLDELFEAPTRKEREGRAKQAQRRARAERATRDPKAGSRADLPPCPLPLPPEGWLAAMEGDAVQPGIVWRGLKPRLAATLAALHDLGHELATVEATLAADGTLSVRITEARLEGVEIRGVHPAVEADVRRLLGVAPGDSFVRAAVEEGRRRVEEELPFLHAEPRRARPGAPAVEETTAPGEAAAARRFRVTAEPPAPGRVGPEGRGRPALLQPNHSRDRSGAAFYELEGRRLIVHFRSKRVDVDSNWLDLIRHTPVTGFAPGADLVFRVWDPGNRAHLHVRGHANVNVFRDHRDLSGSGFFRDLAAGQRFDLLLAPRVQLPRVRVAEIGGDLHALTDTADRWRLRPVDSYIYSALFNRPDTEYFRRTGVSAYATAHLFQRLTAGAEYRRDRYDSMASLGRRTHLWHASEPPRENPAIDDGDMASVVLRVEWHSRPRSVLRPDGFRAGNRRDPETSLIERDVSGDGFVVGTVNTLEIADPGLGGDDKFEFVKLVSDTTGVLGRRRRGLKLRARVGAKVGGPGLPLQKQEALGGWFALRGHDFKELRDGDASWLGTSEYRSGFLSAFADLGGVHQPAGWTGAKLGLGFAFNFGEEATLSFAWRTDNRARWEPAVRFAFQRTF